MNEVPAVTKVDEIQREKIADAHLREDPHHPGRLFVVIPLRPAPSDDWIAYFEEPFTKHLPLSSGNARPTVRAACVEFITTEESFLVHLEDVDRRIAGTNRWFSGKRTPRQGADELALKTSAHLQSVRDRFRGA